MADTMIDIKIQEFASRFGKDISIEPLSDVDREKLANFNIELYKNEFNANRYDSRERIVNFWKWKYEQNPSYEPGKNIGWAALYKGKMVGQFHLIPAEIKIGGSYYPCAWGSDLAILSSYRNLGLSAILILHARNQVEKEYSAFLLGGMNPNSYSVFKNSGFVEIGKLRRYVKVLDLKAVLLKVGVPYFICVFFHRLLSASNKIMSVFQKEGHALSAGIAAGFDEDFERLWDRVSNDYHCIAKRDTAFLEWRYLKQPLWKYTILNVLKDGLMTGYAILRDGEVKAGKLRGLKIGIVTDLFLDPKDRQTFNKLAEEVTKFFVARKAALIKCDILSGLLEKRLSSKGFVNTASPHSFMINIHSQKLSGTGEETALSEEGWHITSGDSDFDYD